MPPKPKKKADDEVVEDVEDDVTDDADDDQDSMLDKLADKVAEKLIAKSTPPKRTEPKKSGILNFLDSLAER